MLAGGADVLRRRAELVELLASQPWGDKSQRYFLNRDGEYVGGLQGAVGIWRLMREHKLSLDDGIAMRSLLSWPGGLELHIGMFIPTILSQGSKEQQDYWMPLCNRLQVVGTYAQTELGHGTFVRGLETVAVYDEQRQEFVCHSPTLSSIKWWPGGLGKTATHVILMARLIIGKRDYGPHAFVVQIRDLETHKPMPGVEVGDIGPKMGFNGVDNGFLRFTYVRVPRDAMLMRFAQVTPEGKYIPPPKENSKAAYATMVFVRASIIRDSGDFLGRAITIATRYCAVRRQTAVAAGQPELQVLDYDNVQGTLLPLLARTYALQFMGKRMMGMYQAFDKGRARGDFAILPELHALSSGLKAACTDVAADGIEVCRRQCGGHGYSILSGLPTLFISYVQNVTWEGDNNVMYLQAARFLVKAWMAAQAGKPLAGSSAYLADGAKGERCTVARAEDWSESGAALGALCSASRRLAGLAVAALAAAGGGRLTFEGPAWNGTSLELIKLAKAHCAVILHQTFVESVNQAAASLSGASAAALQRLVSLHGVVLAQDASGTLLEAGYMSSAQAALLREASRALVRSIRPDAVALVDSFAYPDYQLNSALGRKDGDVYTALLEMAKISPLNRTDEGPAWKPVLEHLLNPEARARL